jgi:hypothetical protein
MLLNQKLEASTGQVDSPDDEERFAPDDYLESKFDEDGLSAETKAYMTA